MSRFTLGLILALAPATLEAHTALAIPRTTGAPGDKPATCASGGCHVGTFHGGPMDAKGEGLSVKFSTGTTYTPGVPLTITLNVSGAANAHFGFQMTARLESDLANSQAGSFRSGEGTSVICENGTAKRSTSCPSTAPVEFIQHSAPAGRPLTFTWTPPPTDLGPVHFYVAAARGDSVYNASYTVVSSLTCNLPGPVITSVNSGSDYGGSTSLASGSWIEIKGSNLASNTRIWTGSDFSGSAAPTFLDGTAANVDGKAAFVYFISPTQINVQVPGGDSAGGPVPVTVTNCAGTSSPLFALKTSMVPGVLASAKFNIGGKQFALATSGQDPATGLAILVGNFGSAFSPYISKPAKPGDTIAFYGIGFGDVNPSIAPGVIVSQLNQIAAPLSVMFGSTPAVINYGGLAPNFVGLYQFNIVVPNVPDGDTVVTFTVNNLPIAQPTFYLTVKH